MKFVVYISNQELFDEKQFDYAFAVATKHFYDEEVDDKFRSSFPKFSEVDIDMRNSEDSANNASIDKKPVTYDAYDHFYKIHRESGFGDIQAYEMAMQDCERLEWD